MIEKNMSEITYVDIESLKENRISESDILDYKEDMVNDQSLIKHVCAFANTRGGHIIFGIKESGKGGHATEISGLDMKNLNKERLEQIILANVVPRLGIKIKLIQIPGSERFILLIRIPDSHLKPHQSNFSKKFYRRFEFESAEMTESEVADHYRSRFFNYDQVDHYAKQVLTGAKENMITTSIIVIPSSIMHRLIDASDYEQITKLESIEIDNNFNDSKLPNNFEPFSHGLITKHSRYEELQIHRNGCIQYVHYDSFQDNGALYLPYMSIAKKLMQTLQFANNVLSHYNYFGDVKIIVSLVSSSKNVIVVGTGLWNRQGAELDGLNIKVERECPMYHIETKYEQVASSIMNDIFNHYGVVRCQLFDEDGNYTRGG